MNTIIGDVDRPVESPNPNLTNPPHPFGDTVAFLSRHIEHQYGPQTAQEFIHRADFFRTEDDFLHFLDETLLFLDLNSLIQRTAL